MHPTLTIFFWALSISGSIAIIIILFAFLVRLGNSGYFAFMPPKPVAKKDEVHPFTALLDAYETKKNEEAQRSVN